MFAVFSIAFGLLCAFIPSHSRALSEKSQLVFYKKSPDLIVVFTGGAGRIELALNLAQKYPLAHMFISGVDTRNSLKTILKSRKLDESVEDFLLTIGNHVELDYLASNTVENGIATLNFLRSKQHYKTVLIVTSDYHVLRSQLIMRTLNNKDSRFEFNYESVKKDYTQWHNLQTLALEVFKLMKTSSFLLFWDKENFI
ncbi:MAG: YdcF family protein [Flavobacteriaceae bacterium]|nr:YdcF family protein [Flavobacteriaceae bacterium]